MRFSYFSHPDGRFEFSGHVHHHEIAAIHGDEAVGMLSEVNEGEHASHMLRNLSIIFRSSEPDNASVDYAALGYAYARWVKSRMKVMESNPFVQSSLAECDASLGRFQELERQLRKFFFRSGYMSRHTMTATLSAGDGEVELEIVFDYRPGKPAVNPAYDHGGLPADPPEVEFVSCKGPLEGDPYDGLRQDTYNTMAENYICGNGYDRAVEIAEAARAEED